MILLISNVGIIMPLDNKKLTEQMIEILRGIPLDNEARILSNVNSYETKISIYDSKCGKCGFKRLMVGDQEVRSLEEAIELAQMSNDSIIRSCSFPDDIEIIGDVMVYPSLTMIVTNTCRFWNIKNIELE